MKVNLGNYTWEEVKDLSDKDPVVLLPLGLQSCLAMAEAGKKTTIPVTLNTFTNTGCL